ncbi:MAG: hypothetical protein JNK82_02420 [Myxococcaceae bacterium]|nr:hypothetical protein [Myxococcaceae bacterium]
MEELHSDVIAARAAARHVAELGTMFRRAVDTYRTYRSHHHLTRQSLDRIYEKLKSVLEAGPVQIEVTMSGLMHEDKAIGAVAATGKREDPLTAPLFAEGVRRITFLPGLEPPELEAFLDSWFDTVTQPQSSEGVTTRFWEAELKNVQMLVIDTFASADEAQTDPTVAKAKVSARMQIDSLVAAISAQGMAGGGEEAARASMMRVGADDISLLRAEGLRDITADSLKRQDVSQRPVATVSAAELAPLAAELSKVREQATLSTFGALLNAAVMASPDDRERLLQRLEGVVLWLIENGQVKEPLERYQQLIEQAKAEAELTQVRTALLVRFKNALTSDRALERLVAAIDVEEGNEAAFEVLQVMRKAIEARLPAVLANVKTAEARAKLSGLLTEAIPLADVLPKVKTMNAEAFGEIVRRLGAMKPADQAAVLTEGLHSHDHGVHRLAAQALTVSVVPLLPRGLFATQLASRDAAIRDATFPLAMELEDPTTAVPMASVLSLSTTGQDERRRIYGALQKLANPKVVPVVIDELERQGDADAKVELVRLLSALGDPAAIAPIEALGNKLLTPGKVKTACKVAAAFLKGGRRA